MASEDVFWILSYEELYSTGNHGGDIPVGCEGTVYQWCKDNSIDGGAQNSILVYQTRSCATPGSSVALALDFWWERSPDTLSFNYFVTVNNLGELDIFCGSLARCGVVPCFAF